MIDILVGLVMFGVISVMALVLTLPLILLWFIMLVRVLNRAGYSGWWSLSCLFTPLFIILIWVLAFADWPARRVMVILPDGRRGPPAMPR